LPKAQFLPETLGKQKTIRTTLAQKYSVGPLRVLQEKMKKIDEAATQRSDLKKNRKKQANRAKRKIKAIQVESSSCHTKKLDGDPLGIFAGCLSVARNQLVTKRGWEGITVAPGYSV